MPRKTSPDRAASEGGPRGDPRCTLEVAAEGRASLTGPLTFATVARLFGEIEQTLPEAAPSGRIDLAGVGAIDSAGVALLLEWQARAHARGGQLALDNAPADLLRLARLCEADELLNLSGRRPERNGEQ
jgi:phospholipid transport system transporter-binding protein